MNNGTWGPKGAYWPMYRQFFESSKKHSGYHFGEQVLKSLSPRTVAFARPLKWWSWDRPQRLRNIRRLRDQLQFDILRIGSQPPPKVVGVQMKLNQSGYDQHPRQTGKDLGPTSVNNDQAA